MMGDGSEPTPMSATVEEAVEKALAEYDKARDITICEDCEHMHPESRKRASQWAMCMKFPRLEGMGFVSRDKWDKDPPYMRCRDINGGLCPLFEPAQRQPQT
jgi:hypothetical protein